MLFYTLTMFFARLHRFEPQPRQQLRGTRVQVFELLNVFMHKRARVQCKSWCVRTGGMKQGEKSHVHRNSASQGKEEAPVAAFHRSERLSAQFGAFQCTAFYTQLICKNIFYFIFNKCVFSGLKTLVCDPLKCLSRHIKRRSTLSMFAPCTRQASR